MGNYNPMIPQILGMEWVPIREEDMLFAPAITSTIEQGHGFTIPAGVARTLQDARFYIDPTQVEGSGMQIFQAAIYPRGSEDLSGPIKRVVIPVNSGNTTGSGVSVDGTGVVDALSSPTNGKFVELTTNSGAFNTAAVECFFATNQYAQQLNGKRILEVNILYASSFLSDNGLSINDTSVLVSTDSANYTVGNASSTFTGQPTDTALPKFNIGRGTCDWWTTTSPTTSTERLPWTYAILQRFEASAANRLRIKIQISNAGTVSPAITNVGVGYIAMEVIYCEETRVAVGGVAFGTSVGFGAVTPWVVNTNIIPMRTINAYALNPVLAAGNYTLVLSSFNEFVNEDTKMLDGLRQYYAISPHPGVQVNLTTTLDDTFTQESVVVLPQLSLHTSGGPLTEVHVYGRQAKAPVYGSVTAIQGINDDVIGVAASFPQVRYYARRFGDTTVPLLLDSPDVTGSSVSLSVSAFDALPEIIDGWKEVTLRFSVAPSMGVVAGSPRWRWSAPGELVGNQWQVLGATAPAVSGTPGNLLTLVPSPNQLSTATYQPSAGATALLNWLSPAVSAVADDATSDAVIMFSQDPATITGLTITALSQAVSAFVDCRDNCCVPTAIGYHRVTWSLPTGTGVASDAFGRTVAAGLGSADVGGAYTLSGSAAAFSVDGTQAAIVAAGGDRMGLLSLVGAADFEGVVDISISGLVASSVLRGGLLERYTDSSNYYLGEVAIDPSGVVTARIQKRVAGSLTSLASVALASIAGGAGMIVRLKFVVAGTYLKLKVWRSVDPEPTTWTLETTDSSLTTGANAGIFARDDSGAATKSVFFDNLTIGPPSVWFGAYELQRMDAVDATWQTIMLATSPATTGFNDYEVRVGVLSSYRVRALNSYNFAGLWSSTVTATLASPGVTVPCGSGVGVLIFTSNETQDGSNNLAYTAVWDRDVVEDFNFLEVNAVQMQQFYDRDFQINFHGSERGGESFSRTLLLSNAAIPLPRLANTHSLRDMAWDDTPYICVRNEIGDRWFATVIVPSNAVSRNRRIYKADITVIEVTDTPSPTDPS